MTRHAPAVGSSHRVVMRALRSRLCLLIVALGCVFAVLADIALHDQARARMTDRARLSTANAAAEIEAYLDSRLLRADALHDLASMIALVGFLQGPNETAEHAQTRLLNNLARDDSDIELVSFTGTGSEVVWSTNGGTPATRVDLSDRRHIRAILVEDKAEYLGDIVRGRISGRLSLQFTRRIAGPAGETLGVSIVSIRPSVLVREAARFGGGIAWSLRRAESNAVILDSETFPSLARPAIGSELGTPITEQRPTARLGLVVEARVSSGTVDAWVAQKRIADNLRVQPLILIATLLLLGVAALTRFRAHAATIAAAQQRDAAALARLTMIGDSVASMVVLWRIAPSGAAVAEFVSGASRALFGMAPDRLMVPAEAWPCDAEGKAIFAAHLARCLEDGREVSEDILYRSADGGELWLEVSGHRPTTPFDGEDRLYIVTYTDITEAKRLAAEAAKTHQRLELVVDTAQCLFYEVHLRRTADGGVERTVLYVSKQIERHTGIPAERYLGSNTPLWSTQSAEAQAARFKYLQRLIANGSGQDECEVMKPDGTMNRMRTQDVFTPLDATSGLVTGFAWDITREAALEQEVQRAAKLAFLGEVAAGMGHEMNQPLAAISLQAAMLEATMPDGMQTNPKAAAKVVSRIKAIADLVIRTADVIDRVRRFSRNEKLALAPFMVSDVLADATELLAAKLRKAGVEVRQSPCTLEVLGDAGALGQVMVNLIGNAVDAYASRQDLADRAISVAAEAAEGMVRITVTDQAGGIDPEVMKRMFAPFVTTKTSGHGTGIGLSICLRLMHWMHGDIQGENIPGGARFTVLVPLHAEAGGGSAWQGLPGHADMAIAAK